MSGKPVPWLDALEAPRRPFTVALPAGVIAGLLTASFPGWTVRELAGRWWAFRSGTFTSEGPGSMLRPVVVADDVTGLAGQLDIQARLDLLPDAELEAIWRQVSEAAR